MSLFMIETGNVDSASLAIGNIASQISNLISSVSSYDTSCEDGFDFSSVKSKILSNIEACVTKVQNTSSILNTISQTHTQLQNTLKFKEESVSNSRSSNSRSTGSYGGYSSSVGAAAGYAAASAVKSAITQKTSKEIKESLKTIGYVYFDEGSVLKDNSKKVFEDSDFIYDENGYAKIGNRYVVSVDQSIGKEGDILKFTQKDGTEIEVIVGYSTNEDKYGDTINFFFNPDKKINAETKELTENILKNNEKIEKIGTIIEPEKQNVITSNSSSSTNSVLTGSNVLNGNVIDTSNPIGVGQKYDLSDDELARLAYVAEREQGSVEGAKLELSLMANLYEKNKDNFSNVLDYVDNSGWFADGSISGYSYPGDEYVAAAREVLKDGNRYLASDVVEHDYLGDLVYCSTGDVYDKSCYVPGETILENQWGARYVFVGFAPNDGDPFGYLIN